MVELLALLVLLMMLSWVLWNSHTADGCTTDVFVLPCAGPWLRGLEVLLYAILIQAAQWLMEGSAAGC